MDHHNHDPKDISGLPDDAVRLEGPPGEGYGGHVYTYHSDTHPGVWSVIFQPEHDPWVIYQPALGDI